MNVNQKERILELLNKGAMTQAELAEAIYGDQNHKPNIYATLMTLVRNGMVIRYGSHPSYYHLPNTYFEIERPSRQRIKVPELTINYMLSSIEKYHAAIDSDYTRYNSWTLCFNAFKKNRHIEGQEEYLCLQLAWYLASWGMLRNSGLMNYDYLVHMPFVLEIVKTKYDALYDESAHNDELIFDAVESIKDLYPRSISKTDTFITKILMGVFGCTPAYDRYFVSTLKNSKIAYERFSRQSLISLNALYDYYDEFEELRQRYISEGTYYTKMKMLDMCFWQIGYDIENSN